MRISLRHIEKSFGDTLVLRGVSCEIEQGEFVTLLGPSGCGKTTLLRILAGLETSDRGSVLFDGFDAAQWTIQERRVGFVFQHYALFPHLSVFDNVAFGLRMRSRSTRVPEDQIRKRVNDLLQLVQLGHLAQRFPQQLSGGQKQRVAVARALAIEPRVLLLDEPFGALDVHVRQDLREQLRKLQQDLGITCLLVTHDQDEALALSDRIMLLNQGVIEQIGQPDQLYRDPESVFAMNYLGSVNELPGRLVQKGKDGTIFVRAHDLELYPVVNGEPQAEIRSVIPRGAIIQVDLAAVNQDFTGALRAEIPRDRWDGLGWNRGQLVSWKIKAYKDFQRLAVQET
ncbi:MAG TPA: ABC transporter ATP-binding protein [Oligoflexus sp.]|uniref:sulfate/molybdate ABC transporter ATP-binding protein n=1 Tax=Oligoflexus sp. TaxID=1971216 RepID=UPI002D2F983B|nr:ABC transporter ATP-binding protein [Oligoflexus sp.]HYX36123.1 ABC transporter ATP-binding protein [Oligoflexus sp.]